MFKTALPATEQAPIEGI